MKLIIFAGGAGTRLWPLSRKSSPKQFIEMFDGVSTLQMAVNRVKDSFGLENIIISTNEKYVSLVKSEIPEIPVANIVAEPEKRDLGPAVCLNLLKLKKQGYKGVVALLWADHIIKDVPQFINILKDSEEYVTKNPDKVVFVGEKPRSANNNLGWIHIGKEVSGKFRSFLNWKYKPEIEECRNMFNSGDWVWNSGYIVEDLDNALGIFEKFQPELFDGLQKIYNSMGTSSEVLTTKNVYPTLPKISHDKAFSENLTQDQALVYISEMGWSDPGTLYALKEAYVSDVNENFKLGLNVLEYSKDTMVYNSEKSKLVVGIGLDGLVVVNTKDAIIVCHKDMVVKISEVIDKIEQDPGLKYFA